jgi:hypothetical protein
MVAVMLGIEGEGQAGRGGELLRLRGNGGRQRMNKEGGRNTKRGEK